MYHIGFFTSVSTYIEERLKNDARFDNQNYQKLLIEAHNSVENETDLEKKRLEVLSYLNKKYGFELIK
jgi:hypothetical protein